MIIHFISFIKSLLNFKYAIDRDRTFKTNRTLPDSIKNLIYHTLYLSDANNLTSLYLQVLR